MVSDGQSGVPTGDRTDAGPAAAVFLVGLWGFVLSALGFVAALALRFDVYLLLVRNSTLAVLVVGWLAADRLRDPTSGVTSVPGTVGTAVLLLGADGLVLAAVVAGTARWHGQFDLVWSLLGGAVVAAVLGTVTVPLEVLTGAANRPQDD